MVCTKYFANKDGKNVNNYFTKIKFLHKVNKENFFENVMRGRDYLPH